MANRFRFLFLCFPVFMGAIITHFFPEQAFNSFLGVSAFYLYIGAKLYKIQTYPPLILVIFMWGLALRFFYISYLPYYVNQHDAGVFAEDGGRGHFQYIYYILKHHTLPVFHMNPYLPLYHPPLHHILSAIFLAIVPGYENLQYLTLCYGMGCAVFSYLFLRLWTQTDKERLIVALFCSFSPTLIHLSGQLNNDSLGSFLTLISLFFFFKHLDEIGIKNLILSAIFLGLAGATKLSTFSFFLGIGLYYLSALVTHQITFRKAFKEGLIFTTIYMPLIGIWPLYTFLHWGKFEGFSVHMASHTIFSDTLKSWFSGYYPFLHLNPSFDRFQYVGSYSLFERLGPIFQPLSLPFFLVGGWNSVQYPEYNIWAGLIKSSLFDEGHLFKFDSSFLHTLGFDFSVALLLSAKWLFFIFIWSFFKTKRQTKTALFCQSIFVAAMIGFLYFNIRNPYWASCSFRYIVPILPLCGYFILQYLHERLPKNTQKNKKIKMILGYGLILFSIFSGIVYTLYGALSF